MNKITAYLRPFQLDAAKTAVADLGITGLNIGDARGYGNSPEPTLTLGSVEIKSNLPLRSRLTIVVPDELTEPVVEALIRTVRTGKPGDGKIFIEPVIEAIRIRTNERGKTGL